MPKHLAKSKIQQGSGGASRFHCAPLPNWGFNSDTNSGHAFGIFMPAIGTLQPSASVPVNQALGIAYGDISSHDGFSP